MRALWRHIKTGRERERETVRDRLQETDQAGDSLKGSRDSTLQTDRDSK